LQVARIEKRGAMIKRVAVLLAIAVLAPPEPIAAMK
jgi:hypothetical protein